MTNALCTDDYMVTLSHSFHHIFHLCFPRFIISTVSVTGYLYMCIIFWNVKHLFPSRLFVIRQSRASPSHFTSGIPPVVCHFIESVIVKSFLIFFIYWKYCKHLNKLTSLNKDIIIVVVIITLIITMTITIMFVIICSHGNTIVLWTLLGCSISP